MITFPESNNAISNRRLDELWLHALYQCNLECRHCLFSCSPRRDDDQMSLLEAQEYVTDAVSRGVKAVYLTGGEPLLWPPLRDFLRWYYEQPQVLPLTILTNGTLITPEHAGLFSGFLPGGLSLRVSLECYTRENHEDYRGSGSFAKALNGIRNLNGVGINPTIAYVNKSGGSLDEYSARLLERDFRVRLWEDYGLEIESLKIIGAYSKGRFSGQVEMAASTEQINERIETVQCNYGVAASRDGVYPCPILVDVPPARLASSLDDALAGMLELNHAPCASCFCLGTTCGN
ncbi:MAG: radical SAM protein [Firmicutes bacterium]|nr:radical SAM protein [Bacillota bacterium]